MPRMKIRTLLFAPALLVLAACSSGGESGPVAAAPSPAAAAVEPTSSAEIPAVKTGRVDYSVSAGGVTTAVRGVTVDTSSAEYRDTCRDAYFWVAGGEGTPEENAEGFLALLQTDPAELGEDPAAGGYWADQTDEQRAAVVAAVYAAARGEC